LEEFSEEPGCGGAGRYLDQRNKKTDSVLRWPFPWPWQPPTPQHRAYGNLSTAASRISGNEQGLAGLLIGKEEKNVAPPAYLHLGVMCV